MHTIQSLYAQSVTADRISRAAAHRAAREASRSSAPQRLKPRLRFRRVGRPATTAMPRA
jgi:hypothetical protein